MCISPNGYISLITPNNVSGINFVIGKSGNAKEKYFATCRKCQIIYVLKALIGQFMANTLNRIALLSRSLQKHTLQLFELDNVCFSVHKAVG